MISLNVPTAEIGGEKMAIERCIICEYDYCNSCNVAECYHCKRKMCEDCIGYDKDDNLVCTECEERLNQ